MTELEQVLADFKSLKYDSLRGLLQGELALSKGDVYSLKIDISTYPLFFPRVYELDERIPEKNYRHVNTDGSLCFTTRAKEQVLLKTKVDSLTQFMKLILIPYLRNNSYYELNKSYTTQEYSHDHMGVIEGYQDILGISSIKKVASILLSYIKGESFSFKDKCYCGSLKTFEHCNNGKHWKGFKLLKLIDKKLVREDFNLAFNPRRLNLS